jgi:hypothetical protein
MIQNHNKIALQGLKHLISKSGFRFYFCNSVSSVKDTLCLRNKHFLYLFRKGSREFNNVNLTLSFRECHMLYI